MLRPTLFIGLGTTGGKILTYLRRHMFEEYSHLGLPVFRYVVIETNEGDRWVDTELPSDNLNDYDRIHVINPIITNTQVIKEKLNPGRESYNENMVEWLDPAVLDIPGSMFTQGAGNIRMAGRLCLWENWEKVTGTNGLVRHLNAIVAEDNIVQTNNILKDYYRLKQINLDDTDTNTDKMKAELITTRNQVIYVVGSLCGGTCSGMMIDLAYWLRSQLGLWSKQVEANAQLPQVYGIFTMIDSTLAQEERNRIFAGNSFAALKEVNFFNHPKSTYHVKFPSGGIYDKTNDPPFDYLLLVSPTGKDPSIRFVDEAGQFDLEGLNQMVAMNLFVDVVAGSSEVKNAIRTDWRANDMYNSTKKESQYTRSLATFGASAVWYPKYRISGATADSLGKMHCESWTRDVRDKNKYETRAKSAWERILRENIEVMTHPAGKKALRDDLDDTLDEYRQHLMRTEYLEEFRSRMRKIPSRDVAIADQLGTGGEYYRIIQNQVPLCEEAFRKALDELLQNELHEVNFSGETSLGDLVYFFTILDNLIEQDQNQCPDAPPTLNLDSISVDELELAENNKWTRMIGLRKKAVLQQKQRVYTRYADLVRVTFKDLRNHFLKGVLRNLRSHLGIGVERKRNAPEDYQTIRERLNTIIGKINNCQSEFGKDYEHQVRPRKQMNVRIVVRNVSNDLAEDARSAENAIVNLSDVEKSQIYSEIMGNDKDMSGFLSRSETEIFRRIREIYQRRALSLLSSFDVISEAKKKLGSELTDLAHRSNPYQTFDAHYKPASLQHLPNLICGKDKSKLEELRVDLANKGVSFGRTSPSPLEHMLVFYMEEAVFALDDLASSKLLENCYRNSNAQYGHNTHQDPNFYDPFKYQREDEITRWVTVALELIPNEVFEHTEDGYCFSWEDSRGMRDQVNVEKDLKYFIEVRPEGCEKCIETIKDALRSYGRDSIISLINKKGQYSKKREFYDRILDELFPDYKGKTSRDQGTMSFDSASESSRKKASDREKRADKEEGRITKHDEEEIIFEDIGSSSEKTKPEYETEDINFWTNAATLLIPEIFRKDPNGRYAFEYGTQLYPVDEIANCDSDGVKIAYMEFVRDNFGRIGVDSIKKWREDDENAETNSYIYDRLIKELS